MSITKDGLILTVGRSEFSLHNVRESISFFKCLLKENYDLKKLIAYQKKKR